MSEVASWLDTIARIFHWIPDLATPEQVQSALREILDDPGLELYWWDWEQERYVDVAGIPIPLEPRAEPGMALSPDRVRDEDGSARSSTTRGSTTSRSSRTPSCPSCGSRWSATGCTGISSQSSTS